LKAAILELSEHDISGNYGRVANELPEASANGWVFGLGFSLSASAQYCCAGD
jgi:hypothetical protein